MTPQTNVALANGLLAGIRQGKDPDAIAGLFSEDVSFEIPGDNGVLPWIGRKTGRGAVVGFIRGLREMTEPIKFDVQDIMASDTRAVIVGDLATRFKATGNMTETAFAIVLTISNGAISRFQMLEDSFTVSRDVRRFAEPQIKRLEGTCHERPLTGKGGAMAKVVSVNVGLPRDVPWRGKMVRTGIWKRPVDGVYSPVASIWLATDKRILPLTAVNSAR